MCATTGLAQSEIRLLPAAHVPEGPVTLGAIAELRGPEAEALADVVVAPDAAALPLTDGWRTLALDRVREALDAQEAPWGALMLRGSACALRIGDEGQSGEVAAPVGAAQLASRIEPGTVGAEVAARLGALLGVAPADLRIRFERTEADLMARSSAGLIIDARPAGLGARTPVDLRIYRGDWIELDTTIRVELELRRRTATTRRALGRGEIIEAADVAIDEAWLAPDVAAAPPGEVIGAVARSSIEAGHIVLATDVEAPVVIERRDRVLVDIVSGSILMQVKMRALEDGRIGDVIELESMEPDRRDRRRLEARVNGPGRAVALVGGPGEEIER
ncbi:MAG: flagellar basal body P-ring formation chaperone FlgA [Phycisphaerales bacterium JB039]